MVTITNLSKSYGRRTLFENISLNINQGEKIGLIGPNGSGKTTLFALITKEIEPSKGSIQLQKDIYIGYLPQEASFRSEATVLSELTEGDARVARLQAEKEKLEEANMAGSKRYGEVLHSLDTLGFFELEYKAKKILMGLGFKENAFFRLISEMSGGWQMRVLLAKLLTCRYDLLLLDEPTNYLDLNAALWLKDYLRGFDGTFIMISHDKAFLTDVTNYTLVLENGSLTKVRGNYEHYQRIKEEKRTCLLKQFKEQERKRLQLQRFTERFHAQPNKAQAVRAKRRVLERMAERQVIVPQDPRESIRDFHFPPAKRSGYRVMALEKISKSYGDIQVYKDLDFEIIQGEKAVLVGENGAGKSTLLKILAGIVDCDSGARILGYNVELGYFSQTRMDVLSPDNTVLEEAYSVAPGFMPQESIRAILGVFLFTGDDSDKKVGVLSGGEKSRLILAKLLINPPNLLLLDEPTTHLDVDAVDALIKALTDYTGTCVFISHDIYFVRSIANKVFEVRDGLIRKFPGNFDYYAEKKSRDEIFLKERRPKIKSQQAKVGKAEGQAKEKEMQQKEEERKRKECNAALRNSIKFLEKEKGKLELENYAKARALSKPHIYRDTDTVKAYGRRLKEIVQRISEVDNEIKKLEAQII